MLYTTYPKLSTRTRTILKRNRPRTARVRWHRGQRHLASDSLHQTESLAHGQLSLALLTSQFLPLRLTILFPAVISHQIFSTRNISSKNSKTLSWTTSRRTKVKTWMTAVTVSVIKTSSGLVDLTLFRNQESIARFNARMMLFCREYGMVSKEGWLTISLSGSLVSLLSRSSLKMPD